MPDAHATTFEIKDQGSCNSVGGTWVSIPVHVSGNTMTMTILDNGPLDDNPAVGTISDPDSVADPTNGRLTGEGKI